MAGPGRSYRVVNPIVAVALLAATASFARAGLEDAPTAPEIVAATYDEFSMSPPTADAITVCHGFGCAFRDEIALTDADRAALIKLMAAGKASAAAERQAIGRAGAWFDRRIAEAAGTRNHVARAGFAHQFDTRQFDCIDASRNMTTLLLVLSELKALRFHTVGVPVARGIADLAGPHVAATVRDKDSRIPFAVDAWTRAYGEAPEILPVSVWMSRR